MAYKYTKGDVLRGDVYAETSIDSDSNTYINFGDDSIGLVAGGVDLLAVTEGAQDKVVINEAGGDVDFIVESPNESKALYLHAANEVFHINHGDSAFQTKIHSTNGAGINVGGSGVVLNEDGHAANDFRVESDTEDEAIFLDSGNNTLYINKGETAFVTIINSTNDEALRVGPAGVVLNEDGHATNDFRVESDSNTHMLFVDAGSNEVGINTSSPTSTFHVAGSQTGHYTAVTGNTTLDGTHHIVDYTGNGDATITLPAVSGLAGRIYHILCNAQGSSDTLTIDADGSETFGGANLEGTPANIEIDGQDTPQSISIVCTGTRWQLLADSRAQDHGG